MIGARSREIIQCIMSSKMCTTCLDTEQSNIEPKLYICLRNYNGNSEAMESNATLEVYENLLNQTKGRVAIGYIIANNDSSMCSYLKHQTLLHPKGTLHQWPPLPQVLSDHSHCTKCMSKPFFALAALGKSKSEYTKVDAFRIMRWWGFMIECYRGGSGLQAVKRAA